MISTDLMVLLIMEYVAIAGVAAYERNWPVVLYFMAAAQISCAVLWGMAWKVQ